MFKKIVAMCALCVMLSGCYMIPMALIGPTTSGFTTASLIQSTVTTSANYLVKKSTGKSISEHVLAKVHVKFDIDSLKHSYLP